VLISNAATVSKLEKVGDLYFTYWAGLWPALSAKPSNNLNTRPASLGQANLRIRGLKSLSHYLRKEVIDGDARLPCLSRGNADTQQTRIIFASLHLQGALLARSGPSKTLRVRGSCSTPLAATNGGLPVSASIIGTLLILGRGPRGDHAVPMLSVSY
jgi:hypothetical protein